MSQEFDFNKALEQLQSGKKLTGADGVLTPLIKQLTEAALKAEIEQHIESESEPNRKNGTTKKTIKSTHGEFELETPRDRAGTFEPQLIKKN
ncbi:transposase, partial [Catenovulum agarivorans]|uniref:transposase n=1 Tax=Catenovulum agarivorans TaxID=1172192 RepID=UPI0003712DF9